MAKRAAILATVTPTLIPATAPVESPDEGTGEGEEVAVAIVGMEVESATGDSVVPVGVAAAASLEVTAGVGTRPVGQVDDGVNEGSGPVGYSLLTSLLPVEG